MSQVTDTSSSDKGAAYAHQSAEFVRKRARSGLQITSSAQAVRVLVQFGGQLGLTHLIAPRAFGLVAMALVVTGFATVVAQSGTQQAIVQRASLSEEHLASALAINLALALIIATVLSLLAPLIASFYHQDAVKPLIWLLSAGIVITSLCGVQQGLLERAMRLKALALIDLAASCLGVVVSIALALAGLKEIAIISNAIVVALATAMLSFIALRWHPTRLPTRNAVRDLLGFTAHLLNFNMINYWARNLDNLLVAKAFGPRPAGLYTRAYTLLTLPLTQVQFIFGRVLFAALSSVQDDASEIRTLYVEALVDIATIMTPALCVLAVATRDSVDVLLGHQWLAAAGLVRIFALLGILQVLMSTLGWIFMSQGKTRTLSFLGLVNTLLYAAGFLIGVWLGSAYYVALSYGVVNLLVAYPTARVAFGLIELKVVAVIRHLLPIGGSAAVMIVGLVAFQEAVHGLAAFSSLVVQTLLAGVLYLTAGYLLRVPLIVRVLGLVMRTRAEQ